MRVFLTGTTGYIGGRLAPRLLEAGHKVVCAVRDPRKLSSRPWVAHENIKIFQVDAADREGLSQAMLGCDAAYYLIHSMLAAGPDRGEVFFFYRGHDLKNAKSHQLLLGIHIVIERLSGFLRSGLLTTGELANSDFCLAVY